MSFRHTYITEFLYKHGKGDELWKIREVLDSLGTVWWHGSQSDNELGYFHGFIKDFDSIETKNNEETILEKLKELGVDIKIVYED